MILNNIVYRVSDWLKQNRARALKWLLILAVLLVGALVAYYGVERLAAWRFEKKAQALDRRIEQKEAEIKASEALIDAMKTEIRAKDALLEELDRQAGAAKKVLERTRTEYVYLKGEYEQIRDNPDVPADISQCGACAELARAGHPCK